MNNYYDVLFRESCQALDLPFVKVKTFAATLSGLNPEFRENDFYGPRVGLMAVPERDALAHGVLPGDLVKPEKNILAGVEILRECYDHFWEIGEPSVRFYAGCHHYLKDWISKQDKWKEDYRRWHDRIVRAAQTERADVGIS